MKRVCACGCGELLLSITKRDALKRYVDTKHKQRHEREEREKAKAALARQRKLRARRQRDAERTRPPRVEVRGAEVVALLDWLRGEGWGKTRAEAARNALLFVADQQRTENAARQILQAAR